MKPRTLRPPGRKQKSGVPDPSSPAVNAATVANELRAVSQRLQHTQSRAEALRIDQRELACAARATGMGVELIAEICGTTRQTVYRWLNADEVDEDSPA